jgi:hypothetical protein
MSWSGPDSCPACEWADESASVHVDYVDGWILEVTTSLRLMAASCQFLTSSGFTSSPNHGIKNTDRGGTDSRNRSNLIFPNRNSQTAVATPGFG